MGGSRCAALGAAWIVLASACKGPALEVTTDPADAVVYVDGRRVEGSAVPFRYYGTVAVDVLTAVGPAAGRPPDAGRSAVRQLVPFSEPVTPWIFPLDFPGELVAWLAGATRDRETRVVLPADPNAVPEDEPPADMDALSTRARAARVSR